MCGIAYVRDLTTKRNVVPDALKMAESLYNRGQHGTGIAVALENFPREIESGKNATERLRERIRSLMGTTAFAHNRYQTSGAQDCAAYNQPHFSPDYAIIYNGNIINAQAIKQQLLTGGVQFETDVDTEVLFKFILYSIYEKQLSTREMLCALEEQLDGAFSFGLIKNDGDALFYRSANAIRPLCYGNSQGKVLVASESIALEQVDPYVIHRSVQPGQMVEVTRHGEEVEQIMQGTRRSLCFVETQYLADARSNIDGSVVKDVRYEQGRLLAGSEQNIPKHAIVCAVPRTAIPFARGFKDAADVDMKDLIIKKNTERTFITPVESRAEEIEQTYHFESQKIEGQIIYLCDDSVIRGPTMLYIVSKLKKLGAKEVHIRIASPPIVAPCYYGINFPTLQELLVRKHLNGHLTTDELPDEILKNIATELGADSIRFTPVSTITKTVDPNNKGLCMACVDGKYPTPEGQRLYQLAIQE